MLKKFSTTGMFKLHKIEVQYWGKLGVERGRGQLFYQTLSLSKHCWVNVVILFWHQRGREHIYPTSSVTAFSGNIYNFSPDYQWMALQGGDLILGFWQSKYKSLLYSKWLGEVRWDYNWLVHKRKNYLVHKRRLIIFMTFWYYNVQYKSFDAVFAI
jgi:hypothetical protein